MAVQSFKVHSPPPSYGNLNWDREQLFPMPKTRLFRTVQDRTDQAGPRRSTLAIGLGGGRFDESLDDHPPCIPDLIRQLTHAKSLLADTNAIELR